MGSAAPSLSEGHLTLKSYNGNLGLKGRLYFKISVQCGGKEKRETAPTLQLPKGAWFDDYITFIWATQGKQIIRYTFKMIILECVFNIYLMGSRDLLIKMLILYVQSKELITYSELIS